MAPVSLPGSDTFSRRRVAGVDQPVELRLNTAALDEAFAVFGDRIYGSWEDSICIEVMQIEDEIEVRIGGSIERSRNIHAAVSALATRLTRRLLDSEGHLLHLHAAGVAKNGQVVLLTGPSGAGKTTAAAACIAEGWDYLSDEMLGVTACGSEVRAWPKPLAIKSSGFEVISQLFTSADVDDPISPARHLGPGQLGATALVTATGPKVVATLGGDQPISNMPAAAAVIYLVEQCMDYARFGTSLLTLCRVVANATAVRLGRSPVDEMVQMLDAVLEGPAPARVVEPIDSGDCTEAVRVGSDVVVRHLGTGRLVGLTGEQSGMFLRAAEHEFAWSTPGKEVEFVQALEAALEAPITEATQ